MFSSRVAGEGGEDGYADPGGFDIFQRARDKFPLLGT